MENTEEISMTDDIHQQPSPTMLTHDMAEAFVQTHDDILIDARNQAIHLMALHLQHDTDETGVALAMQEVALATAEYNATFFRAIRDNRHNYYYSINDEGQVEIGMLGSGNSKGDGPPKERVAKKQPGKGAKPGRKPGEQKPVVKELKEVQAKINALLLEKTALFERDASPDEVAKIKSKIDALFQEKAAVRKRHGISSDKDKVQSKAHPKNLVEEAVAQDEDKNGPALDDEEAAKDDEEVAAALEKIKGKLAPDVEKAGAIPAPPPTPEPLPVVDAAVMRMNAKQLVGIPRHWNRASDGTMHVCNYEFPEHAYGACRNSADPNYFCSTPPSHTPELQVVGSSVRIEVDSPALPANVELPPRTTVWDSDLPSRQNVEMRKQVPPTMEFFNSTTDQKIKRAMKLKIDDPESEKYIALMNSRKAVENFSCRGERRLFPRSVAFVLQVSFFIWFFGLIALYLTPAPLWNFWKIVGPVPSFIISFILSRTILRCERFSEYRFKCFKTDAEYTATTDFRSDSSSFSQLKHMPLFADICFTTYHERRLIKNSILNSDVSLQYIIDWILDSSIERRELVMTVSLEALAQMTTSREFSAVVSPKEAYARIEHVSRNLSTININRYLTFGGKYVMNDTVLIAYCMWLNMMNERADCPFPPTPAGPSSICLATDALMSPCQRSTLSKRESKLVRSESKAQMRGALSLLLWAVICLVMLYHILMAMTHTLSWLGQKSVFYSTHLGLMEYFELSFVSS